MESLTILARFRVQLEALELQEDLVPDQLPALMGWCALLEAAIRSDVEDAYQEGAGVLRMTGPSASEQEEPATRQRVIGKSVPAGQTTLPLDPG